MGRNTFDVEKTFKQMDADSNRKAQAPTITGDYEIEATGMDEMMAYRYQFKVGAGDYFGYARTIEEARENIITAQSKGGKCDVHQWHQICVCM
jgi:hypothetical protein